VNEKELEKHAGTESAAVVCRTDETVFHRLLHNEYTGQLTILCFHLLWQTLAPCLEPGVQLGQAFELRLPSDRLVDMGWVIEMDE
jgi:hypothetical protein